MRYINNIQSILMALILLVGSWFQLNAQNFTTVSLAELQAGSVVKGIYLLELGDKTGKYLKEQSNGTLIAASLNVNDESFYFWISENSNNKNFQIHSAITAGEVAMINENGSLKLTSDRSNQAAQLLLRMDSQGPLRDPAELSTIAIGTVITQALDNYTGEADCQCYGFSLENEQLIVFHKIDLSQSGYSHFSFSKTNTKSGGTITQNANSTSLSVALGGQSQNFVSSLFYVNGFGINDFQLSFTPGTEGIVGFLDYTQHQFKSRVYNNAKPKIGLKIADDKVSLIYLSGDQELRLTQLIIDGEVETNFDPGKPVFFGFENQTTFAAVQDGDTIRMKSFMPAELFINRSVTQTARVMVNLESGKLDLAYNKANGIINSNNDNGVDNGTSLVSTDPYFSYNKGNTFLNTFDWQKTKWSVRYFGDEGEKENEVFSPFYSSDVEKSSITAQFDISGAEFLGGEDFANNEGWELVKANLGYNANGSKRNEAPQYPYVIFYDRVASTLRTFVYVNNLGEANELTLSLGVTGDKYTPLLWGSLQQFSALDATKYGTYSKSIPFYSTPGREWYFYDFIMEYDPCSEFFESSIELKVFKTTRGKLNLVGRLEGGSIPAGTPEYGAWADNKEDFLMGVMGTPYGDLENTLGDVSFNQYEKFGLMEFQDSIGGNLTGANIPAWEKEQYRLDWETQALDADREQEAIKKEAEEQLEDGIFGFIESGFDALAVVPGVGQAVGVIGNATLKRVRSTMDIVEGASTLLADPEESRSQQLANAKKLNYQSIRDQVKYDDQAISLAVPAPRPHVVFGEIALKGTLTIETNLQSDFIATPGAQNSDEAPEWRQNGSRGSAPLYNKPMGKFAMLYQPEFAVAIAYDGYDGDGDIMKAYLKTKQKPYFASNDAALGKITDVFKMAINVKTTQIKGRSTNMVTEGYHNQFAADGSRSLPGEMDISSLIDWDIIVSNISQMTNPTPERIMAEMPKWISISYDVWSLSVTNLKARNLDYVMASGNQYFTGSTLFSMEAVPGGSTGYNISIKAKELADSKFPEYAYGDDEIFGENYQISNNQHNFAAIMYDYCAILSGSIPDTTKQTEITSAAQFKADEIPVAGLKVFPNPSSDLVNFELSTVVEGETKIALYDFTGKLLIQTMAESNGFDPVSGRMNISVLPSGIYILHVTFSDGTVISERILRE